MTNAEVAQVGIGIFQALAPVLISFVLYRQAQSLKRIDTHGQAIQAYNLLNSIAVSSAENLATFDALGRSESIDDDSTRRRRWCAFIWLEALQVTFVALNSKMIHKRYAEQALRQQLQIILKDDLVYWLVVHRGFDPAFGQYCTHIRRQVAPGKPESFTEEEAIKGVGVNASRPTSRST